MWVVTLAGMAALAVALAAAPAARAQSATPPSLLVPSHKDTAQVAEPSPLIVPGHTGTSEAAKTRAERVREYLDLGREHEKNGDPVSAVTAYRNAVMLDTTLVGVASHIADILAALGDDRTAVKMYSLELTRNPGDIVAARDLGLALSRLGDHANAIRQLELVSRRAPQDGASWSALGMAYLAADRAKDAETAFNHAIALPPDSAAERRDLGVALAAQGRRTEARASYRRALAMDSKDALTWLDLANLERDAGRLDSALVAYRAASARDTTLGDALKGEAQTLVALGRYQEAGPVYRRWVIVEPMDLGARLETVHYFVQEGRPDIALEVAREALHYDRNSPDAHLLYGFALDASDHKREAMVELRRAERLFATPTGKGRARQLMDTLRGSVSDSLRVVFAADSVTIARADSTRAATRRMPAPAPRTPH